LLLKYHYDIAKTDNIQLEETSKNFEAFLNYNKEKLVGNFIVLKKFSQYYQLLVKAQLGKKNIQQPN